MKLRGKFVNGKYRVYRPTARELKLAKDMQQPDTEKPIKQDIDYFFDCDGDAEI